MSSCTRLSDKPHSVYRILDTLTGKSYIGACHDVKHRWSRHKSSITTDKKKSDFVLYETMREGPPERFVLSVIAACVDRKTAMTLESATIMAENTLAPNGLNMRCRGVKLPPEHAEHIRTALRREETRKLISDKLTVISSTPEMRKKRATMTGRKHTPESKAKMSASMSGRKQSPEHLAKLSAVRKGRVASDATKAKIKAAVTAAYENPDLHQRLSDMRRGKKRDPSAIKHGEQAPSAKLTAEQVREIHALRSMGMIYAAIATEYGVATATVAAILSGRNWIHIYRELHPD